MRSVRSLGAMTVTSGPSRASTLGRLIAATTSPRLSRSIHDSLPRTSRAPIASARARKLGAERSEFSGIAAVTGKGRVPSTARTSSRSAGSTRLATTATVWAWLARSSVMALSAATRIWSGVRSRPCTTSTTAEPRLAATRALKDSSVPVETSV